MNIEIANRLVQLRKSNNLSQEALAAKLGISRQAVSKWERAEASPDTDNLILLARLYGVSLDDLLKTDDEIPMPEEEASYSETETYGDGVWKEGSQGYGGFGADGTQGEGEDGNTSDGYKWSSDKDEYVHVGFNGVHVKDKGGEVHVGWNGIHVNDKKKGDEVHIDKSGVYVNGEKQDKEWFSHHAHFPFGLIILVVYFIIGCVWNAWHPGWILFLTIPIWHSLVEAIEKKNAHHFAYPVFAVVVYLCLGFFGFCWHPGWVVFLTIPLYYSLVSYFQALTGKKKSSNKKAECEVEIEVDFDEK